MQWVAILSLLPSLIGECKAIVCRTNINDPCYILSEVERDLVKKAKKLKPHESNCGHISHVESIVRLHCYILCVYSSQVFLHA